MDSLLAEFYREIGQVTLPLPKPTPARVTSALDIIMGATPSKKMTPGTLSRMSAGLEGLRDVTPNKGNELAKRIQRKTLRLDDSIELVSPPAVKKAQRLLDGPGENWVGIALRSANKASKEWFLGIDCEHCKGHILPKEGVDGLLTNDLTGVCAGEHNGKFSTFFPALLKDEETLVTKLLSAEWKDIQTSKMKKKALCLLTIGDKSFYAIQILQKSGLSIRTCYPLFYAEYAEKIGEKIEVPGAFSVKKEDVLNHLRREVRNRTIQDRTEMTLKTGHYLVRLSGISGIPLEKGVYLFVLASEISS